MFGFDQILLFERVDFSIEPSKKALLLFFFFSRFDFIRGRMNCLSFGVWSFTMEDLSISGGRTIQV